MGTAAFKSIQSFVGGIGRRREDPGDTAVRRRHVTPSATTALLIRFDPPPRRPVT